MSGLQSLRILTLVLFAVVVAVDAGSNIPRALLSIGNLYLQQTDCTGLYFYMLYVEYQFQRLYTALTSFNKDITDRAL